MKKIIPVAHKGITIKIRREVTSVNGKEYATYVVHDYTSGSLVRHKRSSLEEAKSKAREIAERMATAGFRHLHFYAPRSSQNYVGHQRPT